MQLRRESQRFPDSGSHPAAACNDLGVQLTLADIEALFT